ncbi:uncharacterized protein EDB93DRAFT_1186882 [Suillus bovinus]|uniref:uncharacterized protein n=1 Tax=Suillus bovinus TaxID=48563 RepID=UPI001B86D64D|nr:uncharacterized protein EDB93DRAFT_1186882 [Suillus bovinus]KAG2127308.1 hypothetical protein EDB93DRAFT_1186882 [Suillus bovinus]
MHFSFLAVIVAFAASIMSVSACSGLYGGCKTANDCCPNQSLYCNGNSCRKIIPPVSQVSTVTLVPSLIERRVGRC